MKSLIIKGVLWLSGLTGITIWDQTNDALATGMIEVIAYVAGSLVLVIAGKMKLGELITGTIKKLKESKAAKKELRRQRKQKSSE